MSLPKEIEHMSDKCHICDIDLDELEQIYSQEKMGDIFQFCSQECFDRFLKEPEEHVGTDETLE